MEVRFLFPYALHEFSKIYLPAAASKEDMLEDMEQTNNFICILSADYITSLAEDASVTSFGRREALAALMQNMNIIPIIPKGGRYPGKKTLDGLDVNLQVPFLFSTFTSGTLGTPVPAE
jgi:hypothetical protein